jgi:hypothetical protein
MTGLVVSRIGPDENPRYALDLSLKVIEKVRTNTSTLVFWQDVGVAQ